MMKPDFWGQVKTAAQASPTTRMQQLDQLLMTYHGTPKSNVQDRHLIAVKITETAGKSIEKKSVVDGEYVAARILHMSAQDTLKRLSLDMQVLNVKAKTGMTPKALIKEFRPEVLDPAHHKWGLAVKDYKEFRKNWEQELLGIASNPNSGELAVTSLYDYLANNTPTYKPPTKYYDPVDRARKRLIIANPGEANKNDDVRVMRQSKKSEGNYIKKFDTEGKRQIFVLDGEGHFYATNADQKKDGKWKHHSSLADGGCILGGGEMVVKNGRITTLTQRSGHYHPEPEQVLNVLNVLKDSGVDLSGIRLYAYTYFNDPSQKKPDTEFNGQPRECVVPADYYLATKGQWAYDGKTYLGSPLVKEAPMLGEVMHDSFKVAEIYGLVNKKESNSNGSLPASKEPVKSYDDEGMESPLLSTVPSFTPGGPGYEYQNTAKPPANLGANAPKPGTVKDRIKLFEQIAKANSPKPAPDVSISVNAPQVNEGDWAY